VLKNRNFTIGVAIVTVVGVVLYGTTALLPQFLQGSMGYTAMASGLTLSPRGIGSIAAILLVSKLVGKIDSRLLIGAGLAILAYSSWDLGLINLQVSSRSITWPIILNGMAVSMLFVPLSVTTTSTLKVEEMGNGTGLYNLMRNIGGSIGISLTSTLVARSAQAHQVTLASHVNPYDPASQHAVSQLSSHLGQQQAYGVLYGQVVQQATLWGYLTTFRVMGILCLASIALVLLIRKVKTVKGPIEVH
jgi:DHA2 family multidrug resistance protein